MKKFLYCFLILVFLFACIACDGEKNSVSEVRSLTLVPNNGNSNIVYKGNQGDTITLPTPSRIGMGVTEKSTSEPREFVFLCWVDEYGNEYSAGNMYSFTSKNVSMYARWQLNVCVENLNGKKTIINAKTNGNFLVSSSLMVDPTNTYWADEKGNAWSVNYVAGNEDIVLKESRYKYSISFNANIAGGSGTMENQVFLAGVASPIQACSFVAPSQYVTFKNWNTKADGSGNNYYSGSSYKMTSDMSLYAQWNDPITITFDANGGTGTMNPQTFGVGRSQPLAANTFIAEKKVFNGWATRSNGSGTSYADKANATFSSDTTLYAKWLNTYEVTFDANGGTGTMDAQIFTEGKSQTLKANAYTASKKAFNGWNTKADGSGTSYADKANKTFSSDTTLYAQWLDTYEVTFDANGGTGTMDAQIFTEGKSQTLKANSFTKTGYVFVGWNTKADGRGTWYADKYIGKFTSDVTLYAQWGLPMGSKGQAGGLIFYDCDADNAKGNADGLISTECGWRYLEAAPTDLSSGGTKTFIIGYYRETDYGSNLYVNGANYEEGTSNPNDGKSTGTAIGTGKANTEKLVKAMGSAAYESGSGTDKTELYAAKLADDYVYGGYDDWFLPSIDELKLMYTNLYKAGLGNFTSGGYWSSSENYSDARSAWRYYFDSGYQSKLDRFYEYRVRCVRAF